MPTRVLAGCGDRVLPVAAAHGPEKRLRGGPERDGRRALVALRRPGELADRLHSCDTPSRLLVSLAWRRRTLLSDAMRAVTPSGCLVQRTNRTLARPRYRRRSRRAVRGRRRRRIARRRRRIARRALRRRPAKHVPEPDDVREVGLPVEPVLNRGVVDPGEHNAWGPPAGSAVAATGRTNVAGGGPGADGPSAHGLTTGNRLLTVQAAGFPPHLADMPSSVARSRVAPCQDRLVGLSRRESSNQPSVAMPTTTGPDPV